MRTEDGFMEALKEVWRRQKHNHISNIGILYACNIGGNKMKTKPQPLNLEENPYPKDIFPEITKKEWKRIDELLKKEMGFPLDRVAGNINRKTWNYMREWFIECIKSACEFYLRYKDKPELLIKEHPEYEEEIKEMGFHWFPPFSKKYLFPVYKEYAYRLEAWRDYYDWLFKLAFKDVLENENKNQKKKPK